jgi:hypothetical protein
VPNLAGLFGEHMSSTIRSILALVGWLVLLVLLGVSASCGSGQSGSNVAQIDDSQELEISVGSAVQSGTSAPSTSEAGKSGTSRLTDEEITTVLTTCL